MSAPPESVAAVQEALAQHQLEGASMYETACSCGGWPTPDGPSRYSDHVAVAAADAAVQAARPSIERAAKAEALREAADRAPAYHDGNEPEWAITALCRWLRDRADRTEAQRREDATG